MFKIARRIIGLILLVVAVPASVAITRHIIVRDDRLFGFDGTKLLVACIALALIGASMVGRFTRPGGRPKKPSDLAETIP